MYEEAALADKTKKIDALGSSQWFVRDETESVFGPVDFATLQFWVADGRISPLSEISRDNQSDWINAVDLAELEMDCIAEIEPGSFYGPIHRDAMSALIKAGSIPAGAVLYRNERVRRNSANKAAEERAAQSAVNEVRHLQDRLALLESEQIESRCERDELSTQLEQLHGDYAKISSLNSVLQSDNQQLTTALAQLENDSASAQKALVSELNSTKELLTEAQNSAAAVATERDKLQSQIEELHQQIAKQQRTMDERERLFVAEKRELNSDYALKIERQRVEQEATLNRVRQEFLAQINSLRTELNSSRDELKLLRQMHDALEQQQTPVNSDAQSKLLILRRLFLEALRQLEEDETQQQPTPQAAVEDIKVSDVEAHVETELLEFEEVDEAPSDSARGATAASRAVGKDNTQSQRVSPMERQQSIRVEKKDLTVSRSPNLRRRRVVSYSVFPQPVIFPRFSIKRLSDAHV